ncbi:hypothetical protein OG565_29545 [Streptomyces sp. NBC_00138]
MLETLPALVRGDGRISTVFAYDATSAFSTGVLDLLKDAGCRTIPWPRMTDADPALLISASENIDVPRGDWPVLVLPHGVGFQKMVPDSRTAGTRLSGVVPDSLLESGRVLLAVSHPAQEEQLIAARPKAAGRTAVVGDPVLDELSTSTDRAADYRIGLGVTPGRRLVVLSSTWGPTSLLGRHPGLPAQLLASLPYDEYQVAAIIHPNVWAGHGAWQIRTLLADALDAGLLLIPPVHIWRPALVAADLVIGDHGSVTLYGAALGKPVLLGAFGSDAVPGTAIARLGSTAPHLEPGGDVRHQIESVLATHAPDRFSDVVAGAFAHRGEASGLLRTVLYDLLRLSEPDRSPPPVLSLPAPDQPSVRVTSWLVAATVTEDDDGVVITTDRRPAVVHAEDDIRNTGDDFQEEPPGRYVHQAATDDERDIRVRENSSVLLRSRPAPTTTSAAAWIESALRRYPGSLLASTAMTGGGHCVGVRDGRVVEVAFTDPDLDTGLAAALVYACLRANLPLDTTLTLRTGPGRLADAVLRLLPGRGPHRTSSV